MSSPEPHSPTHGSPMKDSKSGEATPHPAAGEKVSVLSLPPLTFPPLPLPFSEFKGPRKELTHKVFEYLWVACGSGVEGPSVDRDRFVAFYERAVLSLFNRATSAQAKLFAESEWPKYSSLDSISERMTREAFPELLRDIHQALYLKVVNGVALAFKPFCARLLRNICLPNPKFDDETISSAEIILAELTAIRPFEGTPDLIPHSVTAFEEFSADRHDLHFYRTSSTNTFAVLKPAWLEGPAAALAARLAEHFAARDAGLGPCARAALAGARALQGARAEKRTGVHVVPPELPEGEEGEDVVHDPSPGTEVEGGPRRHADLTVFGPQQGPLEQTTEAVLHSVNTHSVIPSHIQRALLKGAVVSSIEQGYVLHNVPSYASSRVQGILELGMDTYNPHWVIDMFPLTPADYIFQFYRTQHERNFNTEIEMRQRLIELEYSIRKYIFKLRDTRLTELTTAIEDHARELEELQANQQEAPEGTEGHVPTPAVPQKKFVHDEVINEEEVPLLLTEAALKRRDEFDLADTVYRSATLDSQNDSSTDGWANSPFLSNIVNLAKTRHGYFRVNPAESIDTILDFIVRSCPYSTPTPTPGRCNGVNVITENGDFIPPEEQDEMAAQHFEETLRTAPLNPLWRRFCCVTYSEQHVIIEGSNHYICVYRGFTYLFCTDAAREKFKARPRKYLNQDIKKRIHNRPILVIKEQNSTLKDLGSEDSTFLKELGECLRYEVVPLETYYQKWKTYNDEMARRKEELAKRRKEEEDERKRLEQERLDREAKARRAKVKQKKAPTKKGKDDDFDSSVASTALHSTGAGAAKTPTVDDRDEEQTERPPPQPPTAAMRLQELIDAAVHAKETKPEVIVSALDFTEAALDYIYKFRHIPDVVIVIRNQERKEEGADEEEEEAPPEEEIKEDADDDGEDTIQLSKPKSKQFDRDNTWKYRKYFTDLLAKWTAEVDEDELPQPTQDGEEEQPQKEPLPRQTLQIINVNGNGLSLPQLIEKTRFAMDPFVEPVTAATADGDEEPPPEDDIEQGPGWGVKPTKESQWGWASQYCPVTLCKSQLLRKGNKELVLAYKGKKYTFATELQMRVFQEQPEFYIQDIPYKLPPPRLWVIGPGKSGRSTLVSTLASEYGVPAVEYTREFFEKASDYKQPFPSPSFKEARDLLQQLDEFDEYQAKRIAEREDREKRRAQREARIESGEIEEDEEEIEEETDGWEPEEESAREERLRKAHAKIFVAIITQPPYSVKGYILDGHPANESTFRELVDNGAIPELVVALRTTAEFYLRRTLDSEVAAREAVRTEKARQVKAQVMKKSRRDKRREIATWKKRHKGEATDEEGDEEIVIDPEPEPIVREDVQKELEDLFEEQRAAVDQIADDFCVSERIDVVSITASRSIRTVLTSTIDKLRRVLPNRQSLLYSPVVLRYDDAIAKLREGLVHLSAFGYWDCVASHNERKAPVDAVPAVRLHPPREYYAEVIAEEEPEMDPVALRKLQRLKRARWKALQFQLRVQEKLDDKQKVREERDALRRQRPADEDVDDPDDAQNIDDPEEEKDEDIDEDTLAAMREEVDAGVEDWTDADLLLPELDQQFPGETNESVWPWTMLAEPEPEPQEEQNDGPSPEELEEQKRLEDIEALKAKYRRQRKCAIFARRAYFFDTEEHLLNFLDDAWEYMNQPAPFKPVIPVVVVDDTGRPTTQFSDGDIVPASCAAHVSFNIKAVLVDRFYLAMHVLDGPDCYLKDELAAYFHKLRPNNPILDEWQKAELLAKEWDPALLAKVLRWRMSFTDILRKGVVIDLHPAAPPLTGENKRITVDKTRSSQMDYIWSLVKDVQAMKRRTQIRNYLEPRGLPVCVFDTALTPGEIDRYTSKFGTYCPNQWIHNRWLIDCKERDAALKNAAIFCKQLYRFSTPEALEQFLRDPVPFIDVHGNNRLPENLPRKVNFLIAETLSKNKLQYKGFCPVTLHRTRDTIGLQGKFKPTAIAGQSSYIVEYQSNYYSMCSEETYEEFLKQPWVYIGAQLPERCPLSDEMLKSIPVMDYMDNILYEQIVAAFIAADSAKPIFPQMSPGESVLKFVALYLKAHNPKNNSLRSAAFTKSFQEFVKCCNVGPALLEDTSSVEERRNESSEYAQGCRLWDKILAGKMDHSSFVKLKYGA